MFTKLFQKRELTVELKLLLHIRSELMSKLDDLKADLADYSGKVIAAVDALKAQVADLQGKVGGPSDADLQGVIDSIDAAKAALALDVSPAPAPAPEPPATPAA